MKRTRTVRQLSGGDVDVRVDPRDIVFPQSACPACARLGSGQPPWRWCRCEGNYVTVTTLGEYQVLLRNASPPRAPKQSRLEASTAGWAKRRGRL